MSKEDIRPSSFADYVGQRETIAVMRRAVVAARMHNRPCGHLLIAGRPGTGKTSLAQIVSTEMSAKMHVAVCTAIDHRGELTGMLTQLGPNDVLFLDEIHALDRKLQETLYTACEDQVIDLPAGKRTVRIPLQPFTLIGPTTRAHLLTGPLRDRFVYKFNLGHYSVDDLSVIAYRSAKRLGVAMHDSAADVIAVRSRGTPRVANNLVRCIRDYAQSTGCTYVDGEVAAAALDELGLDILGLDAQDRAYLGVLCESGKPVGLDAIAAQLGIEKDLIAEVIEPHMLESKLIRRTGAGRVATSAAVAHMQFVTADHGAPREVPDTDQLS
jgi:Holliday junction DNA helicase RuvB